MIPSLPSAPLPPQHTTRYVALSPGDLVPGAIIAFATDATEQRARLPVCEEMRQAALDRCVVIQSQAREHILVADRAGTAVNISLLDEPALDRLMSADPMYLDISGLAHHVWAPLISAARRMKRRLRVIYAEPDSYRPHPSPASPTVFDLSTGFEGVAPLPGFARLSGPVDETKMLLVALLGFEGSRPEHLALEIDSIPTVVPIVGVPGFRIEFPTFTVACNRPFLDEYRAHGNIRLARASCPFEAFETLVQLKEEYPDYYMYLAPIGTKPHSLGAVWFALENPTTTELLYDHPIRKPGRTEGLGIIHIYEMPFDDGP